MAAIDFSKGVDFAPLERLNISKESGVKLLGALTPMIDLEFQSKIKSPFTLEEIQEIGKEAESKGIKPEDGIYLLEEKYHAKTGRYFMEEMRLLFNKYVHHAANIVAQARKDAEDFSKSGGENTKRFEELIKGEKYEDAAKLLDNVLNQATKTPSAKTN